MVAGYKTALQSGIVAIYTTNQRMWMEHPALQQLRSHVLQRPAAPMTTHQGRVPLMLSTERMKHAHCSSCGSSSSGSRNDGSWRSKGSSRHGGSGNEVLATTKQCNEVTHYVVLQCLLGWFTDALLLQVPTCSHDLARGMRAHGMLSALLL